MSLPEVTPRPDLLDDGERLSVDELRALQLQRLRQTLRQVYDHVPHYRNAFDAAGVHPDDCHGLSDLRHSGLTAKVVAPGTLERSVGKIRRIVDERGSR